MFTLMTSHWPCFIVRCLSHPHWQELLQCVIQLSADFWPTKCVCTLSTRLMFPSLSPHRTTVSSLSSSRRTAQMWPSWLWTSTRQTPRISLAAWTWRRLCTVLILCPMTCAVKLRKACWSEWRSLPNMSFLCFCVKLLCNRHVFFFMLKD